MSVKGKRIFITGGGGFIGSAVASRLADGNEIVIYDNGRRDTLKFTDLAEKETVRIVRGDVLDAECLSKSMKGSNVVMHLAAVAGVSSYYQEPVKTMEVNILGTRNVLDAVKSQKLDRYVNFSTSEIYGSFAYKVGENDNTSQGPISDSRWTYSVSKLAGDHLSMAYRKEFGVPVVSLRPFNIYGPGQTGEGAIQRFISRAVKGEDITVTGDGTQIRAWCYIDDMVDAVELCLENEAAVGEAFNIGNPYCAVTILSLAQKVAELAGSQARILFEQHIGTDIKLRIPDIGKAEKILGYCPAVGLEEGLQKTIDWYKRYGDSL